MMGTSVLNPMDSTASICSSSDIGLTLPSALMKSKYAGPEWSASH